MERWVPLLTLAGNIATGLIALWTVTIVRTVRVEMNGRMTQLLTATRAEGVAGERADADARKVVQDAVDKDVRDAGR